MAGWEELERKARYLAGLPVSGKKCSFISLYPLPNQQRSRAHSKAKELWTYTQELIIVARI
jgi:hypothetical protein